MSRITVKRTINAPAEVVFATVADIRNFSQALPHVVDYEFLSDTTTGVGTRFCETRIMRDKKMLNTLEVTEYVENERVRMVADTHGTVWDTLFTVSSEGPSTTLTMVMDARSYKLIPRLMNPLFKGMIAKAVASDMDLVKSYCERQASSSSADNSDSPIDHSKAATP